MKNGRKKQEQIHLGAHGEDYGNWMPLSVLGMAAGAFALMAFVACVISGASGAVALTIPLAVAAMPAGGVPLAVLMAGMIHAGSQVSPTHVCLVVCSEYYKVPLGKLIKRTIPISIVFAAFMIIYYNLLVII